MRLKRRKQPQLTDEEQTKIEAAEAAVERARTALADIRRRTSEVESIVTWLHRARAENHFSMRVRYMIEHSGEEPPWPS